MDDADPKLETGDESVCHWVRGAACSLFVKKAVTQSAWQALFTQLEESPVCEIF